ncbi:MAG: NAD(P)H-dependent oxidoreductase subunit E [Planctomycetota bacterium]
MEQGALSNSDKEYLNNLYKFYQTRQSLLLPALHIVYNKYNYITQKAMEEIAKFLNIHPIKVFEAVSFYNYFHNPDNKPYKLKICTNVPCLLKGAQKVFLSAKSYYTGSINIQPLLFIEECECLAACDRAPVAIFANKYLDNLTEEKIHNILYNFEKRGILP